MSKRIPTVTKELIKSAVLPVQTKTYTVISHGDVMAITEQALQEKGFEITIDRYKCTKSAQVAQGVYYLNYGHDPEMKMMFAWSNSYDKTLRFRCAIGGCLDNGSTILSGANLGSWARRHSGTALQETIDTIKNQIANSAAYYQKLVDDKLFMQQVTLDLKTQSALAGRLFVELDLITSEQISDMKYWIKEDTSRNTLWNFYTYLVTVLQKSHPAKWMDAQIAAHLWICTEFEIPTVVMPNPENMVVEHPPQAGPVEVGDNQFNSAVPHQITLEESIAEVVSGTDIPETIPTGFAPVTESVVIESTKEEPLVSAQLGIMDTSSSKVHIKPTSEELINALNQQKKDAESEFSDMPAEVQTLVEEIMVNSSEDSIAPNQEVDPHSPHIFTAENDECVSCIICGNDIMHPIHDNI